VCKKRSFVYISMTLDAPLNYELINRFITVFYYVLIGNLAFVISWWGIL
jgi:hypothetical protein